jgi:hypothetical protein
VTFSKALHKPPARRRVFTLDEANATLPLVRAIVSDLVELSRDLAERRQRLAQLPGKKDHRAHDPYGEELAQMEQEVEEDRRRLRGYVEELRSIGLDPDAAADGLVGFPAIIDGRNVFLCWKLGEPRIGHWRELGDKRRQRKPLAPTFLRRETPPSDSASAAHGQRV